MAESDYDVMKMVAVLNLNENLLLHFNKLYPRYQNVQSNLKMLSTYFKI